MTWGNVEHSSYLFLEYMEWALTTFTYIVFCLSWQFSVNWNSIAGNSSEPFFSPVAPATSPASAPIRAHDLFVTPFREHHHPFQLTLIPGIGIMITGSAILLLIILILLIHKKNRELRSASNPTRSTSDASSFPHVWKNKKGMPILKCGC